MINKTQKKALLKSLGKKHIHKVMIYAEENEVFKDDQHPFSHSTFSAVINGRLDHPVIENVIFAAAAHHYALAQKEVEARKNFVDKINKKE
jgi:hypothetical protein